MKCLCKSALLAGTLIIVGGCSDEPVAEVEKRRNQVCPLSASNPENWVVGELAYMHLTDEKVQILTVPEYAYPVDEVPSWSKICQMKPNSDRLTVSKFNLVTGNLTELKFRHIELERR